MDDFLKLQDLWNAPNQEDVSNLEQLRGSIKKYQHRKKRNARWVTLLFLLCGLALVPIFIFYKPSAWTTTFGEVLMVLGFGSGLVLKLKSLQKIAQAELQTNKAFLQDLLKTVDPKQQKFNWHLVISVLLLATGYAFFIYESLKGNLVHLILCDIGIAIFTLGLYFVFRPFVKKISKSKAEKLLKEIHDLE